MARSDYSSDSDSIESDHKRDRKRRSKSSSKSRKLHRRDDDSVSRDSRYDSDDLYRKRDRKKKSRKRERKKHKRRDDKDSDSYSSYDSCRVRKRSKKESKKSSRKRKRHEDRKEASDGHVSDREAKVDAIVEDPKYALIEALLTCLSCHPALASDLPVMLIRLAGGTTFDLSRMTDASAANDLTRLFETMQTYGVCKNDQGAWQWKVPAGSSNQRNDLVLVRVVRALLDDVGVSMEAIVMYEQIEQEAAMEDPAVQKRQQEKSMVVEATRSLYERFDDASFRKGFASLCRMIMQGEIVTLDGLPDEVLRVEIVRLFELIGLQKGELEANNEPNDLADAGMSGSDDKAQDGMNEEGTNSAGTVSNNPVFGFGIADGDDRLTKEALQAVIATFEEQVRASNTSRRPVKGPMLQHEYAADDSDDDVGPVQAGSNQAGRVCRLISSKRKQRSESYSSDRLQAVTVISAGQLVTMCVRSG
jgi:hypothetical protein